MILLDRITLFLYGVRNFHIDLSLCVGVCVVPGPEPSTFMQYGKVREKTSGVTETG